MEQEFLSQVRETVKKAAEEGVQMALNGPQAMESSQGAQPRERLMTAREIAERLNCSRSEAYLLLAKELPVVRIGRAVRVTEHDLEDWLSRQR